MPRIEFVDTTVRDGNQSLWGATGLTTAMMLRAAPLLDEVGFRAVDFTTSTHMAVAVRWHRENPWERIRLMRQAMPNTPLTFLTTGMRFISWEVANPELMQLVFRLLVQNGIRRFYVMDPMNGMEATIACADAIAAAGGTDIVGALVYTVSPVHDEPFYAARAAELAGAANVHSVYLKDPGGLLTPERARTLVPAIKAQLGAKPLELHSHTTIGLAQFSYLEAARLGVSALHTAARPLGNDAAQPATEDVAGNLRAEGFEVALDMAKVAQLSEYFRRLALAEGLPLATPQVFDARYFRHQMPGGMLGTMRRQLRELRQEQRLGEVLEEVERVRQELGYPIMVTPFSQVVGTQAVMNVLGGTRYANVPDEVIRYALGRFGMPSAPMDPDVRDRILGLARAKDLAAEPGMPGLAELRRRLGEHLSDEELVLRAVMPGDQVDAMVAAGPCERRYFFELRPVAALLEALRKRPAIRYARVEKPGFRLELRARGGAPALE
jgi:oxaloacetate decarboxylase alpha subunit